MNRYIIFALGALALAGAEVAEASYPHFPYRGLEDEPAATTKPAKTPGKAPKPEAVVQNAPADSARREVQKGPKAEIEAIIKQVAALGRMPVDTPAQRQAKLKRRDVIVEKVQTLKYFLGEKGAILYSVIISLNNDGHILLPPNDEKLFTGDVKRGSRYYCARIIDTLRYLQKSL